MKSSRFFTAALLTLASVSAWAAPTWLTDLDEAKKVAIKENKPILVDFTGSDWCGYCIKLHAEVFDKPEFEAFAKNYVLVELDYPNKKPQTPEVKAKNREIQQKFAVSGFPTILLIDAQSGEAYGRESGYGPGTGPKAYLEKLSKFVNSPDARKALVDETKKSAEASSKRSAISAKIKAAIDAKDFDAASAAFDEMYKDATGANKAVASINKALISQRIDPANKDRALKYADEAITLAAGNERYVKAFTEIRDRIAKGENVAQPRAAGSTGGVAPAAPVGPKAAPKKADQGA
jgi:protein disulfide-isomerase